MGRGGRSLRSRWIRRRKMRRGGQDTGDEKPRMTRKGAKSRKCRNDERETKHIWAPKETRKRQSSRREQKRE